MVTHQITWSGELARHAAYVAFQQSPQAKAAAMAPGLAKHKETVAIVRSRALAVLADGNRHKRAEIDAAMAGLELSANTVRNTLYEMQAAGVIVALGKTTNRWFQLF